MDNYLKEVDGSFGTDEVLSDKTVVNCFHFDYHPFVHQAVYKAPLNGPHHLKGHRKLVDLAALRPIVMEFYGGSILCLTLWTSTA